MASRRSRHCVVRGLRSVYEPVVEFALANRVVTLGALGVLLVMAGLATRALGLEFLPKLEEGNFWIRATMPMSISLEESNGYVNKMRRIIAGFPEVQTAISQHGRPDDGTDATGFFNAEFFVPLKPFDTWPAGMDKEKLTAQLTHALEDQFPGVEFNFSQYIQDNVEEAASGVKGENSVKLFGNDLNTLEATALKIQSVLQTVPGITDLAVLNPLGQPTIRIDIDRTKAARLGLSPGDINATLQAAIGGQAAGDLYEGGSDRHFPMIVRLAHEYRGDPEAIRRIPIGVPDPSGSGNTVQIPLGDVANVQLISGPSFIYREHQERYVPIKFSVRGRDLGSAVLEAQAKVAREVQIPGGYSLEWVGEFGNLQDALHRLAVAVPASIALICVLLFVNFGSLMDVLLAASVIPMALIGGVFALAVTGTPFSVSAAIGLVALFGIATMDGIIVLSYYNLHIEEGMDRVTRGAAYLPGADATGDDDVRCRLCRPRPRGPVHRHWLAGPTAFGIGRGRRHAADSHPRVAGATGSDPAVLAAHAGLGRNGSRGGADVRSQSLGRWMSLAAATLAAARGADVGCARGGLRCGA